MQSAFQNGSEVIQRRVFVVGCPRSGSTLLQSLLAAHLGMTSFRETHFFREFRRRRKWAAIPFLWPSIQARTRLTELAIELGNPSLAYLVPRHALCTNIYVRAYYRMLDTLAIERKALIWVEKTPDHLHSIPLISRYVPRAFFVHIVRDGRDVVASLYDAASQHGGTWSRYQNIDNAIARWNKDIRISENYVRNPDHEVITYARLVGDTKSVLKELCMRLEVTYDPGMVSLSHEVADSLISGEEQWKEGVKSRGIRPVRHEKYNRLFTAKQQSYIQERLLPSRSLG